MLIAIILTALALTPSQFHLINGQLVCEDGIPTETKNRCFSYAVENNSTTGECRDDDSCIATIYFNVFKEVTRHMVRVTMLLNRTEQGGRAIPWAEVVISVVKFNRKQVKHPRLVALRCSYGGNQTVRRHGITGLHVGKPRRVIPPTLDYVQVCKFQLWTTIEEEQRTRESFDLRNDHYLKLVYGRTNGGTVVTDGMAFSTDTYKFAEGQGAYNSPPDTSTTKRQTTKRQTSPATEATTNRPRPTTTSSTQSPQTKEDETTIVPSRKTTIVPLPNTDDQNQETPLFTADPEPGPSNQPSTSKSGSNKELYIMVGIVVFVIAMSLVMFLVFRTRGQGRKADNSNETTPIDDGADINGNQDIGAIDQTYSTEETPKESVYMSPVFVSSIDELPHSGLSIISDSEDDY